MRAVPTAALLAGVLGCCALLMPGPAQGQTLEFESGGLLYHAQTRGGITMMYALLPTRILGYSILQVAVSNGSSQPWIVRPEDFYFDSETGVRVQAASARSAVEDVFDRAGGGDVGRLIAVYESALYGIPQFESTNGYETRRRRAMGFGSSRISAAAAASAIAMAGTVLQPGQSTDGAVFLPSQNRPLGAGRLTMMAMRPADPQSPAESLTAPFTEGVSFDFELTVPAPVNSR